MLTLAERMQHAGIGTVIGIATVFLVLGILLAILYLMQYIFSPKKEEKAPETKEELSSETKQELNPLPVEVKKTDDNQIIAVITAAVAAMLKAQGIQTKFRVKSFRRTK